MNEREELIALRRLYELEAKARALQPEPMSDADITRKAGEMALEGMSGLDKFRAGAGKAIVDTGRGIQQLGDMALDFFSPRRVQSRADASRKEFAETRARDDALMSSGAGMAGNIAGNVGIALAPGGALKGASMLARGSQAAPVLASAGSALLAPKSIIGAAALGGGMGAVQPVVNDDERNRNILTGSIAGAAIPAGIRAYQASKAALAPFSRSGQDEIIGKLLNRVAGSDAPAVRQRLIDAAQPFVGPSPSGMPQRQIVGELIPGSIPTVADVADNAGINALQRAASAIDPSVGNAYASRAAQQNAARVDALRNMAGTDGAREMFGAARDATADTLYSKAIKKGISAKVAAKMQPEIERLLKNPAIQDAIPVAKRLAQYDGIDIADPQGSLQGLHYVKKALDDMIDKAKATGVGKIEMSKMVQTKDRLLGVIDKMSPAYGVARAEFQAASRPINQMDIAAELAEKSIRPLDDTLLPASFARNLTDKTAQRATGFRGATLENVMDNSQMNVLNALKEDLRRSVAAQNVGRGPGSDTVQKLAYSNLIDSAGIPTFLRNFGPLEAVSNIAGRGADALYGRANRELGVRLADTLLDPQQAADVLLRSGMSPSQVQMLLRNVAQPPLLAVPGLLNAQQQ